MAFDKRTALAVAISCWNCRAAVVAELRLTVMQIKRHQLPNDYAVRGLVEINTP